MTAKRRASAAEASRSDGRQTVAAVSLLLLSLLLLLAATSRLRSNAAQIAGDSMAPGFRGLHFRIECARCDFPITGGWQHPPDRGQVLCPNCGFRENQLDESHAQQADRVRIVPLETAGPLQRGDVIAFHAPGEGTLAVKRLVSLPGETPSIRDGDLYVDGHIIHKSLAQLRQAALLVHDDRYRPPTDIDAPGWIPSKSSTFEYDANQTATLRGEIAYHHQSISSIAPPLPSRTSQSPLPTSSPPIRDFDAYNPSLSRKLYTVSDVLLSGEFRLPANESGSFHLIIANGEILLEVEQFEAIAHWKLGKQAHRTDIGPISSQSWHAFSLARFDGRLLLECAGKTIASPPLDDSFAADTPAFRIVGRQIELRHLQIFRDIYYLHPHLTNDPWTLGRPLATDEFFVLGDNSPASTDSRHWRRGIGKGDILGKVFLQRE